MTTNKVKLTDAFIARVTIPLGKSETVIWDAEVTGFGLRLRGDAKSYVVSYRPAGAGRSANMKRVKLGTPETIRTATEARRLAKAVLGKVASGGDPAAEREEQKRRSTARVADLLDRYEADLKRREYVAWKMVMSLLRTRLKRHLEKDIAELKGSDFGAIIERLERDGLAGAADAFRSRARAFMSWAMVKAKVIDANPLLGYRRERKTRVDRLAKTRHGRALSDEELIAVWNAADPSRAFGRFVRFLILTGSRRGEGAGLKRNMIDRRGELITLPAQLVKQARDHVVPIVPALARLLDTCPVEAGTDFVFPSPRTKGLMSGWNKLTAALVAKSGVAFTFHDLRRTFRTGLSKLGVETEVAELAIGHARAELLEIYDRDRGQERVGKAFYAWAEHVEQLVAGYRAKQIAEHPPWAFS